MRYFIVDAFSAKPFHGNPAAVVILDQTISDQRMQAIAVEFNLAETAFLLQQSARQWSLRWFTPAIEIDLCGHATLASAHVLWRELGNAEEQLTFSTLSGDLFAVGRDTKIELNFPAIAVEPTHLEQPVLAQLGLSPVATYRSHHDLLLELDDAALVKNYQPNFAAIGNLSARGLIITAKGKQGVDMVSRFFAPKLGIPEDPVTGAIHCALGPYWANKLDKQQLRAQQLSSRGGDLELRVDKNKVFLAGDAITTMQGQLRNL